MLEAEISPTGTVVSSKATMSASCRASLHRQTRAFNGEDARRSGCRQKRCRRVRNARRPFLLVAAATSRARLRRRAALDRRADRHAAAGEDPLHPARSCLPMSSSPARPRQGRRARGAFRQFPGRVLLKPLGRSQERRPDHRHRPRHRDQVGREVRPDQPARHRRGREVARPGRAAQPFAGSACASAPLHLHPGLIKPLRPASSPALGAEE